jgi:hypothetical protein
VTRSTTLAAGLVVLGVVFVVLAVLYGIGAIQVLTSEPSGPHYKHAILFSVLAVASFVGANFARPKATV